MKFQHLLPKPFETSGSGHFGSKEAILDSSHAEHACCLLTAVDPGPGPRARVSLDRGRPQVDAGYIAGTPQVNTCPCSVADVSPTLARQGMHLRLNDAGELETLAPSAFATPLGMHPDLHPSTYSVRTGDRLLFFTDGLLEARDRAGRFFRLDEHIQTLRRPGLQSAADELLGRLRSHTRHRLNDDVAMLLVELTPTEPADKTPDEHPWPTTPCRLATR